MLPQLARSEATLTRRGVWCIQLATRSMRPRELGLDIHGSISYEGSEGTPTLRMTYKKRSRVCVLEPAQKKRPSRIDQRL